MHKLDKYFKLKPGSNCYTEIHLGDLPCQIKLRNGAVAWGISSSKIVREAAKNCAKHVKDNFSGKYNLPACAENPSVMRYEDVMDTSKTLDLAEASYFQSIIGIVR